MVYFEGVLQLRNPNKEVFRYMNELIAEREGVSIAKKEYFATGVDLYFNNQRRMINISRKLQSKFGGELKINRRLYTIDRLTGKAIYRINILFRVPSFKVGDIIKFKKYEIKVKAIGKKVFGFDIKTGKKFSVNFKDIKR